MSITIANLQSKSRAPYRKSTPLFEPHEKAKVADLLATSPDALEILIYVRKKTKYTGFSISMTRIVRNIPKRQEVIKDSVKLLVSYGFLERVTGRDSSPQVFERYISPRKQTGATQDDD